MTDPFALAEQAADALRQRTGVERHDVAVVLGSGWKRGADTAGLSGTEVALADLRGFPEPTAVGHGRTLRSVEVNGGRVLLYLGRLHLYEGHDPNVVAHGVRTAAAAGCHTVVITNGAGSLREDWPIGQPVLIADHLNLTARSPLAGLDPQPPLGPRFVDLTDLYSASLRALAREVDPSLPEGVYLGLPGPHFETPAEVRMAATLGADLVGMSTVTEAIAARHVGMAILGLSLATNLAAGISDVPLHGDDVTAAGDAAADRVGPLLRSILERLVA